MFEKQGESRFYDECRLWLSIFIMHKKREEKRNGERERERERDRWITEWISKYTGR